MHTKDMLLNPDTGELQNTVTIRSNVPIYNTRIKIYSNGEVQIRKYKAPLSNQKGDVEKKDILTLKQEWLQSYLDEYKKITENTRYISKQQLLLESQISKLRQDIKDIIEKRKNKDSLKKVINSDNSLKIIRPDNLKRTRDTITDFAKEHARDWKSFVTLTFSENICDIKEANKAFQTYIEQCQRYCRKNGQEFLYLGVPEFQKRGAVHYHFLCNIEPNSFLFPRQVPYKKTFSKKFKRFFTCYDCKYWNHGHSGVLDFKECDENFDPLKYMLKYLFKDIDQRLWGHKKILRSLKLRKIQDIKTIDNTPQLLDLEEYLEKKCTKKEFDFKPSQSSYQIPFQNVDYNIIDKSNSNIDEFNLVVSNICNLDKYNSEILAF